MRVATLFRYLIGDRRAILAIAGDDRFLVIGLMFVVSAGFAREYDGTDLLSNPIVVFRPLVASFLAAGFFQFVMRAAGVFGKPQPSVQQSPLVAPAAPRTRPAAVVGFGSTLALFWMTAPLAWIYAIPIERFTDPLGATQANLTALGIVATWRVLLMARALSVLTGYGFFASLTLVLAFAEAVVLSIGVPAGLLHAVGRGMAGIRFQSGSDRLVARLVTITLMSGCATAPVLLILGIWVVVRGPRGERARPIAKVADGGGLWVLAWASILVWVFVLPSFQAEQRLRVRTESLHHHDVKAALELMSQHTPDDYPPHWEPPPHWDPLDPWVERAIESIEIARENWVAPWVRQAYRRKLRVIVDNWGFFDPDIWYRLLELATQYGEQSTATILVAGELRKELARSTELPPAERARRQRILDAYEPSRPPSEPSPETAP